MTIYVDLVFFINFIMDFYILSGVKFLLKLQTRFIRILLGSIVGSLSTFILFFKFNNIELNVIKLIISIIMIFITFGKNNIFNKLFYLYLISIILGGSLYLINDSLGYDVSGYLFINNGYSINLIVLIIISPIIIILYLKELIKYKKKINTQYDVIIRIKNKNINLCGFLDTGNKLVDPYFNRPIILVNKKYLNMNLKKIIYVPFSSLNNDGLLKCVKPEYILVNNKRVYNCLIENLNYDCILNERIVDNE